MQVLKFLFEDKEYILSHKLNKNKFFNIKIIKMISSQCFIEIW